MCRNVARASAGGDAPVSPLNELRLPSEKGLPERRRTLKRCPALRAMWGTPLRRRFAPPTLRCTKGVVQHYADEDHHADMVIVLEGAEAAGRLTVARQPLVIDHQGRGQHD